MTVIFVNPPKAASPDLLQALAKKRQLLPEELAIGKPQGLRAFHGGQDTARLSCVLSAAFEFRDQLVLAPQVLLGASDLVIDAGKMPL
ncbi:MAG: hypothetical protein JOY67_00025 [Hyphomicrobiales bacterium]|nr:hypothetical protein [Hyphomicrobiales bacterium]